MKSKYPKVFKIKILTLMLLFIQPKNLQAHNYCNQSEINQLIIDENGGTQNIPAHSCVAYDETVDNYIYQENILIHSFPGNTSNYSNEDTSSNLSTSTTETDLSQEEKAVKNINIQEIWKWLYLLLIIIITIVLFIYLKKTQK